MIILNVAYPLAPVHEDSVGGAEQVLRQLDRALMLAGHLSLVLACSPSRVRGILIESGPLPRQMNEASRAEAWMRHRRLIQATLAQWPIDLVHLHGIDFMEYLPPPGVRTLATLHLPPTWFPQSALCPSRPGTYLNCVSVSQRNACPPGANISAVIENGVPLSGNFPHRKGGYAVALGRICPEKGFHLALDAAKIADMPLILGGQVFGYAAHEGYFEREVLPRLDARRRFVGAMGFRKKSRCLAGARCLVVPSLAQETSSLVAMEALAAGTPVVAFPVGALPEIVEHGRTGFLVRTVAEMAEAMREAPHLNPEHCRRAAQTRFSAERMTRDYLRLYGELIARPFASNPVVALPFRQNHPDYPDRRPGADA